MKPYSPISRREFCVKATTAGLVLGAPAILKAGTLRAPSDEIRVGFIGCGAQHKVLFEAMLNIPGIRYVAACDIMPERLKRTRGMIRLYFGNLPNGYTDAKEMLEKEAGHLDAVIVATPDFWHAPHTVMALEAGCHVYCEKMMSHTLEGARSMVAAMDRTGKLCQIGHQRRSNPRYRYVLNELIRRQRICGQITSVNGQWNRSVTASKKTPVDMKKVHLLPDVSMLRRYGFDAGSAHNLSDNELRERFLNWRLYRGLSGGPISDLGAHQIDIFNWFFDSVPKSVYATGDRSFFKDNEHFNNVMCVFDYETPDGPAKAFYQVLTTTSAGGGYYESFMGTEGTIAISEREAYTNIYKEASAPAERWDELVSKGYLKKVAAAPLPVDSSAIASYASAPPEKYALPGGLGTIENRAGETKSKPIHQPHVENFFDAIRGKARLTCDARHALESEAPIYWINEAAETGNPIRFTHKHLHT